MSDAMLHPAALAFDAIAPGFDERFGAWLSVAAQRRAVRAALLKRFPAHGRILEIGGGTGEDAAFMARNKYDVLLTDPSPTMVAIAAEKLNPLGARATVAAAEDLGAFAEHHLADDGRLFDGVFSNFAPLNCVCDLRPVASALSRLLKPGGAAMLVVFGTCCPAEMFIEAVRGRPGQSFRRLNRKSVSARLAKRDFDVYYHRRCDLQAAFEPWFVMERRLGIGIAVPPSAAEPWISRYPRLVAGMEAIDRVLAAPFAPFADHVLYQFRRRDDRAFTAAQ